MRDEQGDFKHEFGRKNIPDHKMPPQEEDAAARRGDDEKPSRKRVMRAGGRGGGRAEQVRAKRVDGEEETRANEVKSVRHGEASSEL